jgi:hypothetical protein
MRVRTGGVNSSPPRARAPCASVAPVTVEMRDVAPGLWLWRQPHPDWSEDEGWEPAVSSWAVESAGERIVIDALAPHPRERAVWERLDTFAPTTAVVLKPDHVRDVDLFVRWYDCSAYGPWLFWRTDIPHAELETLRPGDNLPGGLQVLHDPRDGVETPLYLPEQRALVFADGMAGMGGVLRVWETPWLEERTIPALREFLELPFEHVLVSHGEPVHSRPDFESALGRDPWRE